MHVLQGLRLSTLPLPGVSHDRANRCGSGDVRTTRKNNNAIDCDFVEYDLRLWQRVVTLLQVGQPRQPAVVRDWAAPNGKHIAGG